MSALKYQNRIRIEARSDAQDASGQPVDEWILVVTVWANMLQVSGKEFISAARDVSEVTASIRIRYRTGITAAMRVVHKETIYNIKAVLPDLAARQHVDLVVGTGVNDG